MNLLRIPGPRELWQKHVYLVLRVLTQSLRNLHEEKTFPIEEVELNRRFFRLAHVSYYSLPENERPLFFGLHPPAEQTPNSESDESGAWIEKKPDFKWRMQDNAASSPEEMLLDFDIECKRLGAPTNSSWILNEQYVVSGIARFLSPEHRYGNGAADGAMIAYIQNMKASDILVEVNQNLKIFAKKISSILPAITFPNERPGTETIVKTEQELDRREVNPRRFLLHHLWVDMRR